MLRVRVAEIAENLGEMRKPVNALGAGCFVAVWCVVSFRSLTRSWIVGNENDLSSTAAIGCGSRLFSVPSCAVFSITVRSFFDFLPSAVSALVVR